jgi:GMP synthase-like glutamine amidotransferase
MVDKIAILDFGSQYAQLIARRMEDQGSQCLLRTLPLGCT